MSHPLCTVVIPSYNRRATLEMVLEGLAQQTLSADHFEVMVVLDGSTDDSPIMLESWRQSGRLPNLRWHLQPNSGQAQARNTGVQLATTPIIVFLDDDVVPEPELLEAHLQHHVDGRSIAVLGDCLVVREQRDSLYHLGVWAWWEDMYHRRALPGRKPGFRDFCTGNVSLRREDFLRVGGFDPDFRGYGGEDFELGYRLLQAGVEFVSDRRVRARHYHRTTVAGVLRATRQEGRGDILLGQKHPELRSGLRLMRIPRDRYGLLVSTALIFPQFGDLITTLLRWILPICERYQLRRRWLSYFNHIRGYAYWRGVRDALGGWQALMAYRAAAHAPIEQQIDISNGLPKLLPDIPVDVPSRLVVLFREQPIGTLQLSAPIDMPLRPYLAEQLIEQLGPTLQTVLNQTLILDTEQSSTADSTAWQMQNDPSICIEPS
jgi:GT2 family glycosyltransferase